MALPGLNWTAPIDAFIGQITEVDMTSAGLSVIQRDRLLPPNILARLEALPKNAHSVAIGKLSRLPAFKGLANKVTDGIRSRVEAVLAQNEITSERILSVKRDAVFVTGPPPSRLVLPDGTRFKMKASYTSFAKLGAAEVYAVPRRNIVDVKGMSQESRDHHRPFTTRFVLDILTLLERSDKIEAAATLQQFRREYVGRLLPIGFYRDYNSDSAYTVRAGRALYMFDSAHDLDLNQIEIAYNIKNVILPLVRAIA